MILADILENKKNEIELLKKKRNSLKEKLKTGKLTLIAEIKKASPSKGIITREFKPETQLKKYIQGGADALSILTDKKFFQGSNELFHKLRQKTILPLLRKEFIIDSLQIYESFFLGADVILLIAAALSVEEISKYLKICRKLNMEVIVEVHNLKELNKVILTTSEIIGINNRNLQDFSIDLRTSEKIVEELEKRNCRQNYYLISESGIKDKADINYLKQLKIDGVLIGETLMKAKKPEEKIKELGLK